MIPTARAHLGVIHRTADQLGVPLPAEFVAVLANATQLVADTEALEGHTGELNQAVVDALLAGDPIEDDPDIHRLALLRVVGTSGIRQAGRDRSDQMMLGAIEQHADQICDGWIAAVQPDCTTIVDAAATLSDIADLRAADVVAIKNSGRMQTWAAAVSALDRLDAYTAGFRALAAAISLPYQREHLVLQFSDDPDVIDAIHAVIGSKLPDAWTVATLAPLSLANTAVFIDRVRWWNSEQAARQAAEQAARTPDGFDNVRPRREAVVPT